MASFQALASMVTSLQLDSDRRQPGGHSLVGIPHQIQAQVSRQAQVTEPCLQLPHNEVIRWGQQAAPPDTLTAMGYLCKTIVMPQCLPRAIHLPIREAGNVSQFVSEETYNLAAAGAAPLPNLPGETGAAHQGPLGGTVRDPIIYVRHPRGRDGPCIRSRYLDWESNQYSGVQGGLADFPRRCYPHR